MKTKIEKLRKAVEEEGILKFSVSAKQLINLGWVFDDSIDAIREKEGNENLEDEELINIFDRDCIIYLYVELIDNNLITSYEINSMKNHYSNISNGMILSTGNDELTILDIIELGLF